MNKIGLYEYNADNEEPDCMKCAHSTDFSCETCCNCCGPEHGWAGYVRYEQIIISDEIEKLYNKIITKGK